MSAVEFRTDADMLQEGNEKHRQTQSTHCTFARCSADLAEHFFLHALTPRATTTCQMLAERTAKIFPALFSIRSDSGGLPAVSCSAPEPLSDGA